VVLHDSTGATLGSNDDTNGHDPELVYVATLTGTYFVDVGAFNNAGTGTYKVTVTGQVPPDDFADSLTDSSSPIGQVAVNDFTTGTLENAGDRDWIAVHMVAGSSYEIDLQGQQTAIGTLEDPYLRLHDASGVLVAESDDINPGVLRDSQLTFL